MKDIDRVRELLAARQREVLELEITLSVLERLGGDDRVVPKIPLVTISRTVGRPVKRVPNRGMQQAEVIAWLERMDHPATPAELADHCQVEGEARRKLSQILWQLVLSGKVVADKVEGQITRYSVKPRAEWPVSRRGAHRRAA